MWIATFSYLYFPTCIFLLVFSYLYPTCIFLCIVFSFLIFLINVNSGHKKMTKTSSSSLDFKSFRSSLTPHPLWVTLYMQYKRWPTSVASTRHFGLYQQSVRQCKGRYSAVMFSQLSWAGQYKKCVQYDFQFTLEYSEYNNNIQSKNTIIRVEAKVRIQKYIKLNIWTSDTT